MRLISRQHLIFLSLALSLPCPLQAVETFHAFVAGELHRVAAVCVYPFAASSAGLAFLGTAFAGPTFAEDATVAEDAFVELLTAAVELHTAYELHTADERIRLEPSDPHSDVDAVALQKSTQTALGPSGPLRKPLAC